MPYERSLVAKYQGKPFAYLGVDCDKELADGREAAQTDGMTWRSWWDGKDQAISGGWGIEYLPSIFVLDAHGVIRYGPASISGPRSLERAVERLVREAETEGKAL